MKNIFDHEQAEWSNPRRVALGVFSAIRGPMAEAHTFCFSKSSSSSSPSQNTGGTQAGSSAQAVGSTRNSTINTGTLTTVNTNTRNSNNRTTTVRGDYISTGLSSEDVVALLTAVGNQFSNSAAGATGTASTPNGGGVTIVNSPPVSTVQTTAWADVVKKYALWIGLAAVAGLIWLVSRRKKKTA